MPNLVFEYSNSNICSLLFSNIDMQENFGGCRCNTIEDTSRSQEPQVDDGVGVGTQISILTQSTQPSNEVREKTSC